jgi:hypothetical protein
VEGSEGAMMLGAQRLLEQGRIYNIVMEMNKPAWKSAKIGFEVPVQLLLKLGQMGYGCRLSNYGHWTTQGNFELTKERLEALMEEGWISFDMWCSLAESKRYKLR